MEYLKKSRDSTEWTLTDGKSAANLLVKKGENAREEQTKGREMAEKRE